VLRVTYVAEARNWRGRARDRREEEIREVEQDSGGQERGGDYRMGVGNKDTRGLKNIKQQEGGEKDRTTGKKEGAKTDNMTVGAKSMGNQGANLPGKKGEAKTQGAWNDVVPPNLKNGKHFSKNEKGERSRGEAHLTTTNNRGRTGEILGEQERLQ